MDRLWGVGEVLKGRPTGYARSGVSIDLLGSTETRFVPLPPVDSSRDRAVVPQVRPSTAGRTCGPSYRAS